MAAQDSALIRVRNLEKSFIMHNAGGAEIPVFASLDFEVNPGECVVLAGASGTGKSTLMRSIFANYRPTGGSVEVWHNGTYVDIARAEPHVVLDIRRRTLGYVSQFLRVIPRVPTLDIVMDPLLENGIAKSEAEARAKDILSRLNLPEALWSLPPATFSGGEQQRVNIARSFIRQYPIMLLDEPTASLDAQNRKVVIALIHEALQRGAGLIGIFHDEDVRDTVGTRVFEVASFGAAA